MVHRSFIPSPLGLKLLGTTSGVRKFTVTLPVAVQPVAVATVSVYQVVINGDTLGLAMLGLSSPAVGDQL